MTTANTTAQIASFLNVAPNAIKSVTEMTWVFCVVVKGCKARFVSKKIIKETIMNPNIPQTLEAARQLSGIRFHEWNTECAAMVQTILDCGREIDIHTTNHDDIAYQIRTLAVKLDETRLPNVICVIASKLGGKVRNF